MSSSGLENSPVALDVETPKAAAPPFIPPGTLGIQGQDHDEAIEQDSSVAGSPMVPQDEQQLPADFTLHLDGGATEEEEEEEKKEAAEDLDAALAELLAHATQDGDAEDEQAPFAFPEPPSPSPPPFSPAEETLVAISPVSIATAMEERPTPMDASPLPNLATSRLTIVTARDEDSPLSLPVAGSDKGTHAQVPFPGLTDPDADHDDEAAEHLGPDWMETPYVAPSLERARLHRENAIFQQGNAPLCGRRKRIHLSDLGIGCKLHFNLMKGVLRGFGLLLLLHLPALLLYSSGSRIKEEQKDLLGLYALTLGNLGDPSSRWITVRMFGHTGKVVGRMRRADAAVLLAAMDGLSCLVFAGMIGYLWRLVRHAKKHQSKTILETKDFAVFVTNLPTDVTKREVIEHFSALYPLDGPDWNRRPPPAAGPPKRPVYDTAHVGGDSRYHGKWVAEVTLARKSGYKLRSFLLHGDKAGQLKRYRAYLKKHRPAPGQAPTLAYRRCAQRLTALQHIMAAIANDVYKDRRCAAERECVGAFVVFEYAESAQRCLEDHNSLNLFQRFCMPRPLLFQGRHRLVVRRAPAPDDVAWENLEVGTWTRFWRRQTVNVLTLLLLVLSFVVAVAVTHAKTQQSQHVLKFSLCEKEIPALYLHGHGNVTSGTPEGGEGDGPLRFLVPTAAECPTCQDQCHAALGTDDSLYATYDGVSASYSVAACTRGNPCPRPDRPTHCPCVLAAVSPGQRMPMCRTLPCFVPSSSSSSSSSAAALAPCQEFPFSTITACYCYERMAQLATFYGWVSSTLLSMADKEYAVCVAIAGTIAVNVLLQVLLAMCMLTVNALLTWMLRQLTSFERNVSSDVEATQLMLKIFVAQFVNMSILLLMVYGGYAEVRGSGNAAWRWVQRLLRALGVFAGDFHDMDSEWYAVVGVQLELTAIIHSFIGHVYPLAQYLVVAPVRRRLAWLAYAWRGGKQGGTTYLLQQDLNSLYVGPQFDMVYRTGQLLSTIFFAAMYSSGLPILLVFALLTILTSYGVDYLLLLRFYRRPPQRDHRLHQQMCRCLPYALLLHLSMAVWTFGNDQLLGTGYRLRLTAADRDDALWADSALPPAVGGFLTTVLAKVRRAHTVPLFVLWVAVLTYVVIVDLLPSRTVTSFLSRARAMCRATLCGWCAAPRRQSRVGTAPDTLLDVRRDNGYSKTFERPVPPDFNPNKERNLGTTPPTSPSTRFRFARVASPRADGGASWDVFVDEAGTEVLRKLKSHRGAGSPSSPRQQCMRTWELLKQNQLWSYDLRRNTKYKEAVLMFSREFSNTASSPRNMALSTLLLPSSPRASSSLPEMV